MHGVNYVNSNTTATVSIGTKSLRDDVIRISHETAQREASRKLWSEVKQLSAMKSADVNLSDQINIEGFRTHNPQEQANISKACFSSTYNIYY